MKLKEGHYWVKRVSNYGDRWYIGYHYGDDDWTFLGIKEGYEEDVTFDVGEYLGREPK